MVLEASFILLSSLLIRKLDYIPSFLCQCHLMADLSNMWHFQTKSFLDHVFCPLERLNCHPSKHSRLKTSEVAVNHTAWETRRDDIREKFSMMIIVDAGGMIYLTISLLSFSKGERKGRDCSKFHFCNPCNVSLSPPLPFPLPTCCTMLFYLYMPFHSFNVVIYYPDASSYIVSLTYS